jgi:hypothetical protein
MATKKSGSKARGSVVQHTMVLLCRSLSSTAHDYCGGSATTRALQQQVNALVASLADRHANNEVFVYSLDKTVNGFVSLAVLAASETVSDKAHIGITVANDQVTAREWCETRGKWAMVFVHDDSPLDKQTQQGVFWMRSVGVNVVLQSVVKPRRVVLPAFDPASAKASA